MSLGGIVSMSLTFFISRFLRFLISVSLTVLKENLSLRETSDPLTTCLFFIKLGMIFVRIDNRLVYCQNLCQRFLVEYDCFIQQYLYNY